MCDPESVCAGHKFAAIPERKRWRNSLPVDKGCQRKDQPGDKLIDPVGRPERVVNRSHLSLKDLRKTRIPIP